MISLRSGASISATVLLHVILAFLFMLGLMEHTITPPEAPPVLVEFMQTQPTPKTSEQPVAKPIPVPPRPQPVAAPALSPQPQPSPSKVSAPTEVAQAAPVAPVSAPTTPTPPAPPAPAPAPVVTAPSKTEVSTASYSASNQKPTYPNMSKRLGEQGTVVLRVLVKADGSAGEVEVKSSSSYPRLDQAAVEAVKTWRFNSAKIDGKAIDEWYQVPIPFKLQSSSN